MPKDLRLVLTKNCNYQCGFCHQEGVAHELFETLNNDDYVFLYNIIKSQGYIDGVTLTGGEPLLYKNLLDLSRQLNHYGANITLITNGSLLDTHDEVYNFIKKINISLHTLDQTKYETLTQTKTSVQDIISNIATLKQQHPNLILKINATIAQGRNDTKEDILAMVDLADQYGLAIKFMEIYPQTNPEFQTIQTTKEILENIGFRHVANNCNQQVFLRGKRVVVLTKIFCGAAENEANPEQFCREQNDLFLSPDAWISPCPMDIKKVSLYDALKTKNTKQIENLVQKAISDAQTSCVYTHQPLEQFV